jgi:hypothetical protein
MVYFSNLKALSDPEEDPFELMGCSGKRPSISSSRSYVIFALPLKVSIYIGLPSKLLPRTSLCAYIVSLSLNLSTIS